MSKPQQLARVREQEIAERLLKRQASIRKGEIEKEVLLQALSTSEAILEEIRGLRKDVRALRIPLAPVLQDRETKEPWYKRLLTRR